ncbi:FadR/GntR family transcriptional regulator [Denitromonas iodatirespirans]|uniref:FadR family transcriptional regulator n=1 Tax=Denitromonas iodatirespirans TaxID=2795389 RepID=A0A944HBK5_DENI1|nr:FadR/GntR family transcriptional regulator [Denitromonas iodatirespirans]MBT0961762.1 FadR family transcriptional regulator [Denitromonas iodatirespirans]
MPSISNIAAQTLQRRILSGDYAPGTALPSQRELSDALGISRASLREAISMLEALGMVRSQAGKGVFVTAGTRPPPDELPTGPNAMPPAAIFQLRYVVEPASASLAAQRAAAADLSALHACQAGMKAALTACDLVMAADADLRFHLAIAALSGNPALGAIAEQFKAQLAFSLRLPFADRQHVWQPADEHQAIVDAIVAGDAAQARRAMQTHLLAASQRVGIAFVQP